MGRLFAEQGVESLPVAIERLEALELDAKVIRDTTRRFGREGFRREVTAAMRSAVHGGTVQRA